MRGPGVGLSKAIHVMIKLVLELVTKENNGITV